MEIRAECSKKAGSTPSDALIETLMVVLTAEKKCFSDNKNKDRETFLPSAK